jgi:hypothetical protein
MFCNVFCSYKAIKNALIYGQSARYLLYAIGFRM